MISRRALRLRRLAARAAVLWAVSALLLAVYGHVTAEHGFGPAQLSFILSMVGLVFLFVGGFVWRIKPGHTDSWAFLLFSSAVATTLFGAEHSYEAPAGYERLVMNLPLLGATTLHLFTVFPTEPLWIAKRRGLRLIPYGVAALAAAAAPFERAMSLPSGALAAAGLGVVAICAAGAAGVLIWERVKMRGSADTTAADIVLAGILAGFVPVGLLFLLQMLFAVTLPLPYAMVWFVVFPLAVGAGIVRGQIFDVRSLARSSAAYGAATLAITGLFATLITSANMLFQRFNVNANSPWFSVVFLFFAILAFNPLRERLQTLVDRLFDRDRAGYRTALRDISEAMISMLSIDEISNRMLTAVTHTMGVARAMLLIRRHSGQPLRPAAWRGGWQADPKAFCLSGDHPLALRLEERRRPLSRADFDSDAPPLRDPCRAVFDDLDVRLLVPILFGGDLLGAIAVGDKLSGESLGADDRQLLRTLSNNSAIAIKNAQAFAEIEQLNETLEARVAERNRELQDTQTQLMQSEKMRSLGQLVAGVAHELNNPIGFVHANLRLLEDYVEKLVQAQENGANAGKPSEAIEKLLARSREGTERVKNIVLDLRTFSRMDQAELSDADLNDELERTLGLMEPRFKGGIEVQRDFGALPPVRCYPAQLNQVFMNLLMNACDALDGCGEIRLRTRAAPGGVSIEITDSGPGVPPEARGRVFEPFFTTKPVGQGTGLGLSIAHSIVERHGGSLSVHSPPTGGATFQLRLPLVAKPPEEPIAQAHP